MMVYCEYLPRPPLSAHIKCIWTLESQGQPFAQRERILPDGCIELILNYGDRSRQHMGDGGYVLQPRSFIHGQMKEYIEISPDGNIGIIGVRFYPFGLAAFVHTPVFEFTQQVVAVGDLFGNRATELEDKILTAGNNYVRVAIVSDFLERNMLHPVSRAGVVEYAVKRIAASNGSCPVRDLAAEAYMSERQLERLFRASVGISPKAFSRISRFQHSIRAIQQDRATTLTDLAYAAGYYDQAHFIRDFREFAGTTPAQYFSSVHPMSDLFTGA